MDLRSLGLKYCTATSNQETVCIIQNTKTSKWTLKLSPVSISLFSSQPLYGFVWN